MIGTIIICCLLFSLNAAAQEQAPTDSISTQKSKSKLALRLQGEPTQKGIYIHQGRKVVKK